MSRATTIVVTGHGTFATGLVSAVSMLGVDANLVRAIDFTTEVSPDELERALRALADEPGELLAMCDLLGGTPYNRAVAVARGRDDMRVVAGVNLAMVIEAAFALPGASAADVLAAALGVRDASVSVFGGVAATGGSDMMSEDDEEL